MKEKKLFISFENSPTEEKYNKLICIFSKHTKEKRKMNKTYNRVVTDKQNCIVYNSEYKKNTWENYVSGKIKHKDINIVNSLYKAEKNGKILSFIFDKNKIKVIYSKKIGSTNTQTIIIGLVSIGVFSLGAIWYYFGDYISSMFLSEITEASPEAKEEFVNEVNVLKKNTGSFSGKFDLKYYEIFAKGIEEDKLISVKNIKIKSNRDVLYLLEILNDKKKIEEFKKGYSADNVKIPEIFDYFP